MAGLGFDVGTFRATAADAGLGDVIEIACTGECDLVAAKEVEQLFKQVHEAAAPARANAERSVVLDLREVSFMASSAIAKLVAWIGRVRDLPVANRYRIRIRSSERYPWQKRSLQAVQFFAPEVVTIEACP